MSAFRKQLYQNSLVKNVFFLNDWQAFETAVEVRSLWQHIEDVLASQEQVLEQDKILFDGHGNLAVEALDVVVDQLP